MESIVETTSPRTTASGHTSAIRAQKVIGTKVKNRTGETLGTVEDIVLDKLSDSILFAVVGFGGFLGMAEKYHPVPWAMLEYDEREGCYVVGFTKEQLKAAPCDSIEALTRDGARQFRDQAAQYYGAAH
jgi:sporulation protein YlmC with PRC-barrel domain